MKKTKESKKEKKLYEGVTENAPYEQTAEYQMISNEKNLFNSQGS